MDFFFLIILSIPIFYFWGLASFVGFLVKLFKGKNDTESRRQYLKKAITELSAATGKQPDIKAAEILKQYQAELATATPAVQPQAVPQQPELTAPPPETKPAKAVAKETLRKDIQSFWINWYSENSINLLLYLGAFLIVASASIFVSFQWQAIGGYTKALLISLFTLAWFIFGLWFYQIPKIKKAGATFTAIGALLIPFCGLAWYNFVLKGQGVSFGEVWLATSLIALSTYIFIAWLFRSAFYTYTGSVSALSLVLSFVNISHLDNEFYVLGSMVTALVLLMISYFIPEENKLAQLTFCRPLQISAHLLMPLAIMYGFITAMTNNSLFTMETTMATFLAVSYYLYVYLMTDQPIYLSVSQMLGFAGCLFFFRWQGAEKLVVLTSLDLLAVFYLALGDYFKDKKTVESETSFLLSITGSIMVFLAAKIMEVTPAAASIFALIPAIFGATITLLKDKAQYIYLGTASIFGAITIYLFINDTLGFSKSPHILGNLYLLGGIFFYILTVAWKRRANFFNIFALSSILYFTLSLIFNHASPGYLTVVATVLALIFFHTAFNFNQYQFLYASNVSIYFSLLNLLSFLAVSIQFYPLAFSGLGYLFYLTHWLVPEKLKSAYRLSSLTGILVTPIVFALFSLRQYLHLPPALEQNALLTAYLATALFALDASITRESALGYFASAIGMITFLWQIKYLHITQAQAYTIPLGIYFLVLAYLRRLKQDWERRNILDAIGLFIMLSASLIQSFGVDGFKYALLFAVQGLILFILGNSLKYKTYIYAGIFAIATAVISQTYEYVFSLPRWIITGSGGLIFISLAMYLLLHRKDKSSSLTEKTQW